MGRGLTPDVLFTYWVLLGLLHGRIFHFPVALKHVKEGVAALGRLEGFLCRAEAVDARKLLPLLAPPFTLPMEGGSSCALDDADGSSCLQLESSVRAPVAASAALAGVRIDVADSASFSWFPEHFTPGTSNSTPSQSAQAHSKIDAASSGVGSSSRSSTGKARGDVLQGLRFSIPSGSLTAIVGGVGTGKTALLLSILGETRLTQGRMTLAFPSTDDSASSSPAASDSGWPDEPVAYVPQHAWILSGLSIRDNILLGRPWDSARYAEVLRVTALLPDLDRLPAADATLVASCTLSGGQKQRISLARAAYSRAGLVLLDDALSALDGRVGAHVLKVGGWVWW
jgi:ABC-type multidrug transport system fused ATPase/permease subunit